MQYIIIGGSIAGISAAKAIRESNADTEITMISEEGRAYYRPMIPFLIERDDLDVRFVDDPVGKYSIVALNEKARSVDMRSKEVLLSPGKRIHFDKLLIATGSKPIIPDIPGLKGSDVFTLRTMDDALRIKSFAKGKKQALVIGGGFVGTKASIALGHIGLKVTIIEKLAQILPQRLDRRGSKIISDVMRNAGIEIVTGDSVSEIIRKSGVVKSVRLSSGKIIDADIVIVAIGAKPNVDGLKDSGIKINNGILINEFLQTNIPDIYAAGDVVEYMDLITGMPSVSALWTNAEEMGRFAGKNMAGANIEYKGFLSLMNSTEIFGVPAISIGLIEPEGEGYEIFVEDKIGSYRKFVFKDDTLAGAIFIGDVSSAGIYTNLIKNKIPMGRLKEEAVRGNLGYINFVRTIPAQTLTV